MKDTTPDVVAYELELKRIRIFSEKWKRHFNELASKCQTGEDLKKSMALVDAINGIIDGKDVSYNLTDKEKVDKINGLLGEMKTKGKLSDRAVSESGLDMNEVLNPTEDLDLSSLIKELGLKK